MDTMAAFAWWAFIQAGDGHIEPRRIHTSRLGNVDQRRFALNNEDTLISLPVPKIDVISWPAPDRPNRQIEPERRCWIQRKDDWARSRELWWNFVIGQ